MMQTPNPYKLLRKAGIEAPHRAGITLAAHPEFLRRIALKLRDKEEIDRLLRLALPERNPRDATRRSRGG